MQQLLWDDGHKISTTDKLSLLHLNPWLIEFTKKLPTVAGQKLPIVLSAAARFSSIIDDWAPTSIHPSLSSVLRICHSSSFLWVPAITAPLNTFSARISFCLHFSCMKSFNGVSRRENNGAARWGSYNPSWFCICLKYKQRHRVCRDISVLLSYWGKGHGDHQVCLKDTQ